MTEKNCSYLEVELINDIIEQAVKHGGDPGGPHRQNSEDLIKAVNKLLQYIGLSDKYKVCDVSKESCFDGWSEIKIVAKKKGGSVMTCVRHALESAIKSIKDGITLEEWSGKDCYLSDTKASPEEIWDIANYILELCARNHGDKGK